MLNKLLFLCAETFEESKVRVDVWLFNRLNGYETFWVMPDASVNSVYLSEFDRNPVWLIPKARSSGIVGLIKDYVFHFWHIQRAVNQAIKRMGSVDIVQVRDDPIMAYVAWRLSQKLKIPFVYQLSHFKEEENLFYAKLKIYGNPWINYLKGKVGLVIRNRFLRKADLIFPISQQMKETLNLYGLSHERMVILPTGVDASLEPSQYDEQAKSIRRNLSLENKRILIYLGTMNRFRQLDFLFGVLKRLLSSEDVHLLMVGEGREPEDLCWLRKKASELGVERHVTFTGRVPGSKVPAYIRAADVGLSPFPPNPVLINNSPIKILEYLNMERPVVASDIPDQRSVIEESQSGYCVPHEEDAFVEAILKLLNDPTSARLMGQRGRRFVKEKRDFRILTKIVENAYQELLNAYKD
jgi:glycosyltransferase involved in cell wall biosynthesis